MDRILQQCHIRHTHTLINFPKFSTCLLHVLCICSALQHAASCGFQECVPLLLDHGTDIDAQDQNMATALSVAAQQGQARVVKLLIDSGADVTVQDHK